MPPAPEFLRVPGRVRNVKIQRDFEAQRLGGAAGDVAVPGEIAINLHGKGIRGDEDVETRGSVERAINLVDNPCGVVGHKDLLVESPIDQPATLVELPAVEMPRGADLGQEVTRPLDGTRDQLRKEGYKQREIQKAAGRLQTSLIDVDGVTHRLERIERDADRQQHRQHEPRRLETRRRQQRRQILREEIEVFEKPQDPQIAGDTQPQPKLPLRVAFRAVDNPPASEIEQRRENNQAKKPPVPEAVKEVACHQQQAVLQALAEAKVQPENDQEEDAKLDGVENDTLSPRFWEVSRFPDYTFHNPDAAGTEQGGFGALEK